MNIGEELTIQDSAGTKKTISIGGVIPIIRDLTIQFNENTKGEIKQ